MSRPALHLVALTDEELAALRALPELVERLTGAMAKPAAPAYLTPSEVRGMARVAAARVFAALASGELPGERMEAQERKGRDGSVIPGMRWRIRREDAEAWARAIAAARPRVGS